MAKPKHRPGTGAWMVEEVDHLFLAVARYTRFVFFSKWFLGIFALVIMGGLIAWPFIGKDTTGMRVSFQSSDGKPQPATAPVMQSPHFVGDDEKGQRYAINGARAIQQSPQLVLIEQMQSQLVRADGSTTAISSDSALYHQDTKMLELHGHVNLIDDKGAIFVTPNALVDTNTFDATGAERVDGTNAMGNLVATGFKISDKGNRIFFGLTPGIKLHIDKMRQNS